MCAVDGRAVQLPKTSASLEILLRRGSIVLGLFVTVLELFFQISDLGFLAGDRRLATRVTSDSSSCIGPCVVEETLVSNRYP